MGTMTGRATMAAVRPTLRQRLAGRMSGDARLGSMRYNLVHGLMGSNGVGDPDQGLVDFTPVGTLFQAQEGARKMTTPGQRRAGAVELGMAVLPIPASGKPIAKGAEKAVARGIERRAAYATHEATPGVMTGHLPEVSGGSAEVRGRYAEDPRSSWADAEGKDKIYSAMGLDSAATLPATGIYTPPGGAREVNPAQVARPKVEMQHGADGPQITAESRAALNGGEAARAYVDAQGAGAWHMPVSDAPEGASGSVFVPHDGPLTLDDIEALQAAGEPHGLGDVVDTGEGATMTAFYPDQPSTPAREALDNGLGEQIDAALPGAQPQPARVRAGGDTGYIGYEDAWGEGVGSGAVTRELQGHLTPDLAERLDSSPDVRQAALDRLQRDEEISRSTGQPVRPDVQNARRIISEQGFKGLFDALQKGAVLPATVAGIVGVQAAQDREPQ